MTLTGTVMNGVVVLEAGACVPDGTKVHVDIAEDLEHFEYPHPMAPYDREKEIALLQASHQEVLAGDLGMPFEQFEAELAREFGFRPIPRE